VLDGRTSVALEVRDTGPGIPEGLEARIFDRFYRLDESRSKDGTGLGLSIARQAVEACQGHLGLERGASGGSVFRIVLPTATADAGQRIRA
jgi:signal transduction histidine kinase